MDEPDFEAQLVQEKIEEEQKKIKTKVDEDGTEYEWDDGKKAWFPKIDDDFIARYQMGYGIAEADSASSDFPAAPADTNSLEYKEWYEQYCKKYYGEQWAQGQEATGGMDAKGNGEEDSENSVDENSDEYRKKYFDNYAYYYGHEAAVEYCGYDYYKKENTEEKAADENQKNKKGKKRKKTAEPKKPEEPPSWFDVDESKNTNVYVSGLPLDITDEEYRELMGKYGLIMADPVNRGLKLKLYKDSEGNPKGDGRCCFIKVESVELAMKFLDDSELRGHKVKVELAKFSMKGDFDPNKRKKKLSNKDKRKFKEKQAKLFDWRPEKKELGEVAGAARQKNEKVVVLKNMFDPNEFEEDPTLINDLRDDVRMECGKFGEVKNVKIFDNHPDGVMMVYFKAADSADGCIAALHQRWFSKRRVIAQQWDGRTKYEIEESEAERNERLSKWEKFLESDNTKSQGESECVVTKSQSDDAVDKSAKTDSKSEPNDVEVQPNNNKGQDDIGSIDKSNGKGSSNSQDVSLDTMPSEEETGDSAMITE
ncbi:HIV Tat-specific factor 1-like [Mizuhopecten yessoensis]|uniref:17S U2 SnRNP complex component HTATSF1 n=1 Tax=Mizuhopecten yessoensis TaxID=6573 RepID=A0A210PXW5_MIZYE|nr:HIV Tat-specific factor 1-like [Mizuhopecten yessoensis]OWF41338.1 HIV Tat-specific factor 1 [Mizuhopecten yessoensis]